MPTPPSTTSSARGGRIGSPGAALYDMTNEELDELLSEDGSEYEEEKPSLKNDAPTILRGQLVEPRFKTLSLRQLHGACELCGGGFCRRRRGAAWLGGDRGTGR